MRHLLAATCLSPVALCLGAAPLFAETVIANARTTPIATSTAAGATRDDVRISSAGSVKVTGGTAVTLNSPNNVKNEGTVAIAGANNTTGILATTGGAGSISNTGTITLDETYSPADADKDGDIDGPFAKGSGRHGIRVGGGESFTGSVTNSGKINVEGNGSAAIAIDSRLVGSLASSGTIEVLGDDSHGIRAGDVTGSVKISAGSIGVRGKNAVGVALDGDIGGALVIQGAVASSGYRYVTAPADPSKLDSDDLLQGGSAVRISGNVAGGILFDARPADKNSKDDDEDDDGVKDANESTAVISSYGAAPAVEIGSATENLVIGAVAGTAAGGHGLVVNGTISGSGVYKGVAGNGLVIGGKGGSVSIAGGMTVNGTVAAKAIEGNATAIRIGKASVPELRIRGTVGATGGVKANTVAQAILIESGANVTTIRNSGTVTAATGGDGSAAAIVDRSGRVTLVENSGSLGVAGTAFGDKGVAIDLSATTSGVTVRQLAVGQNVAAPSISGALLFGGGNDLLEIADGSVTGPARFGAGSNRLSLSGDALYDGSATFAGGNDIVALAGTSRMTGDINFGGGADMLTLAGTSSFRGSLSGSSGLAVTVSGGGSLDLANQGNVQLASLALGPQSSLTVNVDSTANTNTLYNVAGQASFGAGTKVNVALNGVSDAAGRYTIVRAGSLSGAGNLTSAISQLPFLFSSSLIANEAAGEIALDIRRKTTAELGLNASESSAFDAIFAALDSDEKVADVFLAIDDAELLRSSVRQMLPNHAGGIFESVTQGSRATARFLTEPNAPYVDRGGWGFWLQQVAWGTAKSLGDTASYDVSGWGASGGAEVQTGAIGNFGLSLAYLAGKDADGETDNQVAADQYELAAHWRGGWNALAAYARVSAARIEFEGSRRFGGSTGGEDVVRTATGSWNGDLLSAAGGLSYEARFGRLTLRPAAAIDYYRLKEAAYTETGGGSAFALSVDSRTSDELAATGSVALGYDFAGVKPGEGWFRVEIEGGRREILGGSLGRTVARFGEGDDFVLVPEDRTNGWVGKLRLLGGSTDFQIGAELNAEEQQGRAAIAARATLQFGF